LRIYNPPTENATQTASIATLQANGLYYAKPIKGIVSSTSGLVNGDRYILTSDVTTIRTIGGINESLPDGAVVSVLNSAKTYLRQGIELLERDPLIRLTGTVNFYISPTGSNLTGTGSSTQPWSTLAYALTAIARKHILQGVNLVINCADGIYNTANTIRFPDFALAGNIYNQLIIQGNSSNPEAVEFKPTAATSGTFFELNASSLRVYFRNITFNGINPNQDLVRAFDSPGVFLDQTVVLKGQFRYGFVALTGADINCSSGTTIILKDINCKAIAHAHRAYISLLNAVISVPLGNSAEFTYFVESSNTSSIQMSQNAANYLIQGSVTGARFKISSTGQLVFGSDYFNPVALDFLPGTLDGEINPGGVYQSLLSQILKDSAVISVSSANAANNYNVTAGGVVQFGTTDLVSEFGLFNISNSGATTLYNGRVEIKGTIRIQGVTANAGLDFRLRRNGTLVGAIATANIESLTSSSRATAYPQGIFSCSTNDVFELWAVREAGGTVNSAINVTQGSILSFKQV
jgi:hypothetical protein